MGGRSRASLRTAMVAVVGLVMVAAATTVLSVTAASENVGDEVTALMAVKAALQDPGNVLRGWDTAKSGQNPCRWSRVYCRHGQLRELNLRHKNLSGALSPEIGRLTSLRYLYLSHNAISGPIPDTIGRMHQIRRLDLSNNRFNGSIPSALGDLLKLKFLELNNNSLSGPIPNSLATARKISKLDLSFNNLSGCRPRFRARTVMLEGNPQLSDGVNWERGVANSLDVKEEKNFLPSLVVLCIGTFCLVTAISIRIILFMCPRHEPQQVFSGVDAQSSPEGHLGHLKQYKLGEIEKATDNFSQGNIVGEGAFGMVYKGCLPDGSIVAVKRLKGHVSVLRDDQFHTEVEVISLVAHRNLLHLIGYCTTGDERILMYPYMPNGSVASKLQEQVDGEPALDWPRRKMIALGAARGLRYLHEQCDPKVIHRDIKASNVLLDEHLEAVIADFGLAKLVDHGVSRVITMARGTIGRMPPEAVRVGYSSEKTDIFCFGLLLIEIITGRKTLELHPDEYKGGGIIELARELLKQNQLSTFVDKRLRNNYDSAELEQMVQIAMICAMYDPDYRPRMSDVVRMLQGGDGVAEKWDEIKDIKQNITPPPEFVLHGINYYDSDQLSSILLESDELSGPR